MGNREVNLTKRIQTTAGWRYCPVVLSANGRVKADVVMVNGKEERHPEGAYYLEWREAVSGYDSALVKMHRMLLHNDCERKALPTR